MSAKQHAEKDLHSLKKLETNRDKGRQIYFPRIISRSVEGRVQLANLVKIFTR